MSRIREIGESIGNTVFESIGRAVGRTQEERPLPADLLESEEAYLAVFDAPGADREDVQARFEGGRIEVRVDRFREFHEGFTMRFPGRGLSLDGSVALPEGAAVDAAAATATLTDSGTLQVRVPKADAVAVDADDPGQTGDVAPADEAGDEPPDGE